MHDIEALPPRIRKLLTVCPISGCWVFVGRWTTGKGHAKTMWQGHHVMLHRVVYSLLVAPVCWWLNLDHLCRFRGCSNPDHLEPVPPVVNTRRGEAKLFKRRAEYT